MIHKTKGIVLKTIPFGETSVIATIYTQHFGRQTYMVNGVRTAKSKYKALLQPLTQLELVVYKREHKNIERIKEMKPSLLYHHLPFDMVKRSIGIFLTELLYKAIQEETHEEELFDFISAQLNELDEAVEARSDFHLRFMLNLTKYLGFYPQANISFADYLFDLQNGIFVSEIPSHLAYLKKEESRLLADFISNENQKFISSHRKIVLQILEQYYQLHLPNFRKLASPKVLEEVFD